MHEHAGTLTLTFSDGDQITTTPEHPFFVDGKGFVSAGQLAIGTSIVTRAGPVTQVTGITSSPATVPVYNFTVADDHTYFVGTQDGGEWVHNTCLELKYKPEWNADQVAAADAKIAALNEAAKASKGLLVREVERDTNIRRFFTNNGNYVAPGEDVDHTIDLQFGGKNDMTNLWRLNRSVNRSLGKQIGLLVQAGDRIKEFKISW